MKPKHWFDKTYKINFYIYYGWPEAKYRKHIEQTFGLKKTQFGDGHTMIDRDRSIIAIWIRNKKDYPVIAHESFHASNFVFEKIGHNFSCEQDEPQAYYIERIFKEIVSG